MLGVEVAAAARLGEVPPARGNPSILIFCWYCAHHVQLKQAGAWILACWGMANDGTKEERQKGRGSEEVSIVLSYRRSRGIRNTSRHISFEFLIIKTCPPDKLHNGFVNSHILPKYHIPNYFTSFI